MGLKALVTERLDDIDPRAINSIEIGNGIVLRVGRYGPYLVRGDERASVPDDTAPDELTVAVAEALLANPSADRTLGVHPETGNEIAARSGRYGPYVTEVLPEGSTDKPRTASLFKSMALESMTLEDALRLLTLPRSLGSGEDGAEVIAQNGRYGPFIKRGTDTRSLETEEQLLTVTLEEATAVLAQPKTRRGRSGESATPRGPLREVGADPSSGKPLVVKDGRFGPYVTDGETNASLRRGDDVESLTIDRAVELLAERRAAGPSKRPKKRSRS